MYMLNTRPVLILVLKFEEDFIIPFLLNYLCFGLFQIWLFIDLGFFMMKFCQSYYQGNIYIVQQKFASDESTLVY